MELIKFQTEASEMIASRFAEYIKDPLIKTKNEIIPFYQNLSSITGERVIIVMGAICVLKSRVSGTLTKYNSCIA